MFISFMLQYGEKGANYYMSSLKKFIQEDYSFGGSRSEEEHHEKIKRFEKWASRIR